MEDKYDFIFKIILIGDSGCGKTCIIDRYRNNNYNPCRNVTIGVEFGCKNVTLNLEKNINITINSHFWDTSGQEIFKPITKAYYKNAAGIILCYDTTNYKSFNGLDNWLTDIRKECSHDTVIMLIGTKIDLEQSKCIETEIGRKFAYENNILFYEVSSKKDINIRDAFNTLLSEIYYKYENGTIKSGIKHINNNLIFVPEKKCKFCCYL